MLSGIMTIFKLKESSLKDLRQLGLQVKDPGSSDIMIIFNLREFLLAELNLHMLLGIGLLL